jgi:hypothetical protein
LSPLFLFYFINKVFKSYKKVAGRQLHALYNPPCCLVVTLSLLDAQTLKPHEIRAFAKGKKQPATKKV